MSKERELLRKILRDTQYINYECNDKIRNEIVEFLAKPKREPKFTFDLERMTLALDSPISDVTVGDLMKQVKQAMLEVGNE